MLTRILIADDHEFVPKGRLGSELVPALEAILKGGTCFKVALEKKALQHGAP
jgi:hypothetical protein